MEKFFLALLLILVSCAPGTDIETLESNIQRSPATTNPSDNDDPPESPGDKPTSTTSTLCEATQVANSDMATAGSITGEVGDVVKVTCNTGFTGGGNWTCNQNGSFSGTACTPPSDCGAFYPKNSTTIGPHAGLTHGQTTNVVCLPGFSGDGVLTCNDGTVTGHCTDESTDYASGSPTYIEEDFHCDLDADGVVDLGEEIDFPDHSFVMKFVLTSDKTITLPTTINGNSNFYVDWGDGKCEHSTTINLSHVYESPFEDTSEVQVRLIGVVHNWGNSLTKHNYMKHIKEVSNLGIAGWSDLKFAFSANSVSTNMTKFNAGITDTSLVGNFGYFLSNNNALDDLNIESLDTSSATQLEYMFMSLRSVTSITFGENFTTENVIEMGHMFRDCIALEELDLSGFDTSNVKYFSSMFNNTVMLKSLDLSHFNTSSALSTDNMFYNADRLTKLDLSNFDTTNVTNMQGMFSGANSLRTLNFGNWEIDSLSNSNNILNGANALTDIYCADTHVIPTASNESNGLKACSPPPMILVYETTSPNEEVRVALESNIGVDINWGDNTVTEAFTSDFPTHTYSTAGRYEVWVTGSADFIGGQANWTNSSGTNNLIEVRGLGDLEYADATSAFKNLQTLQTFNGYSNVSALSSFDSFFEGTTSLVNIDLKDFDTSGATSMSSMFAETGLYAIDFNDYPFFDTSIVTDMNGMFRDSTNLTYVDVSTFDTSNVTDMVDFLDMGNAESNLQFVNLGAWEKDAIVVDSNTSNFFGYSTSSLMDEANTNSVLYCTNTDDATASGELKIELNDPFSDGNGLVFLNCADIATLDP